MPGGLVGSLKSPFPHTFRVTAGSNTVKSRYSKSRFFGFPFRPSQCSVITVDSISVSKHVLPAFVYCFLAPFVFCCVLLCGLSTILTHLNKTGVAVRITTNYRLDCLGSNPGEGKMYSNRPARLCDPHSPIKWVPGNFHGGKRPPNLI